MFLLAAESRMRGPGGSTPGRLGLRRAGNNPDMGLVRLCPMIKLNLMKKAVPGGVHKS